jgi:hypothetical protein
MRISNIRNSDYAMVYLSSSCMIDLVNFMTYVVSQFSFAFRESSSVKEAAILTSDPDEGAIPDVVRQRMRCELVADENMF